MDSGDFSTAHEGLNCLAPGIWLNDIVIFHVFNGLLALWNHKQMQPTFTLIEPLWNIWFRDPERHHAAIKAVATKLALDHAIESDYFIFPFNKNQVHWLLMILNKEGKCLIIDSDKHGKSYTEIVKLGRNALSELFLFEMEREAEVHVWKDWWKQSDSCNCGVFTCMAWMFILRKPSIFKRLFNGEPFVLNALPSGFLDEVRQDIFVFLESFYPYAKRHNWDRDMKLMNSALPFA